MPSILSLVNICASVHVQVSKSSSKIFLILYIQPKKKKKLREQQVKLLNWSGQIVPASLHLFGLGFLSSFQLCQVINSKSDIFGVNVGILGFTTLELSAFSKSKSLFFFNLKQNLLFIIIFLGQKHSGWSVNEQA